MLVLPDNIKKMIANESFFYDKVGMYVFSWRLLPS